MTSCSNSKDVNEGPDSTTSALNSLFEEGYATDGAAAAPGGAVLMVRGDSVIYEHTLFNITSVSKQFTVAALLQQDIDIYRTCSDFFPEFPQPFWYQITLAYLASRTSALPDSRDCSVQCACVYADEE